MPPVLCGGIKRTRVCLQKGKGYLCARHPATCPKLAVAALLALWSRARWGDCQIGSNDLTARGPPSRPRLVRVPR